MDNNEEIIKKFWSLMSDREFDKAGNLMTEDVVVRLPNTREVFRGRNKYIDFNKMYPGIWMITIERIFCKDNDVVSAVKVETADNSNSFYATSFFALRDNLICEITEYWGENGAPPEWRIKSSLSERY